MTLNPTNNIITTTGSHTLTVAEVLGGIITRTGGVSPFTDTLPATSDILAALGAQTPFLVKYFNAVPAPGTLVAGDADTTIAYSASMNGETELYDSSLTELLFTPLGKHLTVTFLYSYRSNF